jgi:hypothetical protein
MLLHRSDIPAFTAAVFYIQGIGSFEKKDGGVFAPVFSDHFQIR